MLSEVSQAQKDKSHMFSLIHGRKQPWPYTNSYVEEHICNSGTTLWNLGKEGKEKRMIEHQ
jgi:hypothetical protein